MPTSPAGETTLKIEDLELERCVGEGKLAYMVQVQQV